MLLFLQWSSLVAVFPNLSLLPALETRAFHGSDIPIIFGTYTQSPLAATPTEIAFSKYIQSVWVGFARDPKQGLIDLGWPEYDPSTASLVELGGPSNRTGATFTDPALLEVLCSNQDFLRDTLAGLMNFLGGD
jgi:carboxylesterase type B